MYFKPSLTIARLIRRHKRFLVDVELADGGILTVHCPNTGSMLSCSSPGSRVAISRSDNPKRKYPHTLEMVEVGSTWVGVNTGRTNTLVAEAISSGRIGEFREVSAIQREVKVSAGSRLDMVVSHQETTTYIEVKNCSLVIDGCAQFPDAVTTRGTKHLNELLALVRDGNNSCIFFLVQRGDAKRFAPARHIDPLYSTTLDEAVKNGVKILAYQADVSPEAIEIVRPLPCEL